MSDRGTPKVVTGQDILGTIRGDLQTQITANAQGLNTITGIQVGQPEPCTPDFVLSYIVEGGKIFPNMCVNLPAETDLLKTYVIKDSDALLGQAEFDARQVKSENTPDDDARQTGHFEFLWDGKALQPSTLYRLVTLVAKGEFFGTNRNPFDEVLYTDPPLATFTTPAGITTPLTKPHVGNIIENNLDDTTTRQFDVWLSVQIIAPSSASSAATGLVSTAVNSTTVTGSGTAFLTDFPAGSAIEVNGETHIVSGTPASNTSLTVDFPFKTLNTNQAATKKTLHTFDSAGIIAVAPKFRATTDSEDKAISPHFALSPTDGALTSVRVKVPGFFAGKTYNWVNNLGVGEGNARISSLPSTTQTFTAGNFTTPTANIPEWTTAPFFQYDATDPQNDNKRDVSLRIVETVPPIAKDKVILYRRNAGTGTVSASTTTLTGVGTDFLTSLAKGHFIIASGQTLEVQSVTNDTSLVLVAAPSPSISGVSWTKSVLKDDHNLQIGKFHPSTGGLIPRIKFGEIKTKKLTAFDFVAVIYAINGQTRTITDSFTTDGSGEVILDTAVPILATNPDTGTTGPTVTERHSKIDISCPLPSANINTLDNYQVVLQNANTTITGDPVVGVSDVLVIKYGQNPTFNLSYFADFGDQFYVRFRAHNQFDTGYSVWSASTNQDGYSRPLQDFIGDAVPDAPEGLVRESTSGTGHTTTTFVLESGASAVDDFYTGNALHITSPGTSSPAQDTWRTITDYVGSTRTCTVDTAFSSSPSGALAYDIHRIGITGDRATKSGTGHTTTTFVLDASASAVTDFYVGYTLYDVAGLAADRIRKVEAYNGTTKTCSFTLDPFGVAPSGNLGYLLVNGSIGFSTPDNADSLTGIASPVSFRWYLNDSDTLVFETLPPNDENAFSLTHFQIQSNRRNVAGALRDDSGAVAIVSGAGYQTDAAPVGTEWASRIRFRNMFRDTGIDGWGSYSYYVAVLSSADPPNYDPDVYGGTVVIDYQGEDSYPTGRYPEYL